MYAFQQYVQEHIVVLIDTLHSLGFTNFLNKEVIMGWPEQQKLKTREKILNSAAHLFTNNGFEKISIDMVMKEAGLTRGAFYAHFSSKADLYNAAITQAAKNVQDAISADGQVSKEDMLNRYMSLQHLSGENFNCPIATLITDIQQRDNRVRDTYTQVFEEVVKIVAKLHSELDREAILSRVVLMVGSVAISRALNCEKLAQEVLIASRQTLLSQ